MEEKLNLKKENINQIDVNPVDNCFIDLTEKAKHKGLARVIGRSSEIRRVEEILSRKQKSNPLLIGEPGVGKTAIAEGIAFKISSGSVPPNLRNKKLISVELAPMLAGPRGLAEKKINELILMSKESNGEIIFFIDEIHTVLAQLGEILKPALARGEIKCIGATTTAEYQKYFSKDVALARRFLPVKVNEPTRDEAILILNGVKESYEKFHKIKIMDEAIVAAVDLSSRYITDKFLPDKAIDLLDEASASLKIDLVYEPEEINSIMYEILQNEKRLVTLRKENTRMSLLHAKDVEQIIADLKNKLKASQNKAQQDYADVQVIELKKKELEIEKNTLNKANANGDVEQASESFEKIDILEKELKELEKNYEPKFNNVVNKEAIAKVVEKKTGINVGKLMAEEKEKILALEDILSKRIIGQDEALKRVANVIKRSKADIQDENRPLGSFLFLGPTGVGKTEVAKALAEQLFGADTKIIRYDMSEFANESAAQNLIGSPVGYVGYESGGRLTNDVMNNPYSIVLFDEIEKAHPRVFDVFLQLLDEGQLTDNRGTTVNFRNTLIIMTSNIGASYSDIKNREEREDAYKQELQKYIKPEIINRIDEVIVFNKLNDEAMLQITRKFLKSFENRLAKQNLALNITDRAIKEITYEGMDANFGARPLRRYLQTYIETPIAEKKLELGEYVSGEINVDYIDNKYIINIKSEK